MRIAILLCAQPRFFNLTYKHIKKEFDIPGVEVDYFIHFWNVTSFSPFCEKNKNYTQDENIQQYIEYINPKKYLIEDYKELNNLVFLLKNMYTFFSESKIILKDIKDKHRYEFGQWLSNKKAYTLMEEYENINNFKYDIVIRTKTDYIYSNTNKLENYIIPEKKLHLKYAIVSNLKIRKFIEKENGFKNYNLQEYIPQITLKEETPYTNIRYDINTMAASRSAAFFLYNTWFETYIKTLIFDKINRLKNNMESHKKQDVVWGNIAIYNKIHLITKKRRYIRLYIKDKCKKSWLNRKENTAIDVTGFTHYRDLNFLVQK